MIFEYLNFENKYTTILKPNEIIIQEATTSEVVASVLFVKTNDNLQFQLQVSNNTMLPIVLPKILEFYKLSNATILETLVPQNSEILEYLHCHDFQMMSVNNQFKFTHRTRNYYED